MEPLDSKNLAIVTLGLILAAAMLFGMVIRYNATERDRSVACSEAGGSYEGGRCDVNG